MNSELNKFMRLSYIQEIAKRHLSIAEADFRAVEHYINMLYDISNGTYGAEMHTVINDIIDDIKYLRELLEEAEINVKQDFDDGRLPDLGEIDP